MRDTGLHLFCVKHLFSLALEHWVAIPETDCFAVSSKRHHQRHLMGLRRLQDASKAVRRPGQFFHWQAQHRCILLHVSRQQT